jgi:hypothetical protein
MHPSKEKVNTLPDVKGFGNLKKPSLFVYTLMAVPLRLTLAKCILFDMRLL